jgi:rifampicin phosphotransferase
VTEPIRFSRDWILPLDSAEADLPRVGGKGANLARLVQAGFRVPDGFLVTTAAYRAYSAANGLEECIRAALEAAPSGGPEGWEVASTAIRARFAAGTLPDDLARDLRAAYARLGQPAVAVRSSATAEDLPEMSFAGQQDTYLNVVGEDYLLRAVVDCWSSLWTARAMGYRARNGVPSADVALAVVVQEMVASQASGVLFTANPLTGLRAATVLDATLGLGEALVSGQVEPDHYVVDPVQGRILSRTLGRKQVAIYPQAGGGTQRVAQARGDVPALPDDQVLALARMGQRVAELFGFPQDIEWAWAQETLYLLQARPITALFPLPEGMAAEPLKVMFSFAAVQGMLDPLTPLGCDALRLIFAAGAGLFGMRVTPETQTVLYTAGERLWVNVTTIVRNTVGRRVAQAALELVEPSVRQALDLIWDDPRLQPGHAGISLHARLQIARFAVPLALNVLRNLLAPRTRRAYIVAQGEEIVALMQARCAAIQGDRWQKLAQAAELLPRLIHEKLGRMFALFISGVAAGMASWNLLNQTVAGLPPDRVGARQRGWHDLVLLVTRGMPHNPTTEMDLTLWGMAQTIRRDAAAWQTFQGSDAATLATRYRAGDLPPVVRRVVGQFLEKYGGRGLGEIDLGRTRWAEDPTHVFEMLASFLQIEDTQAAPDAVFARGAEAAQHAINQLAQAARGTRLGWLKAHRVRFLAGRARQLMGLRENPKFFAVRLMWWVQRALLQVGAEFVQAGDLQRADDLFYLSLAELRSFAAQEPRDWRGLIAARRASYRREAQRRQIPRLLLSDGRAFYEGLNKVADDGDGLHGSPVSPGSTEGRVRVVRDPRQAHLLPGEILVCPGTDPSWTPLFLSAAGLVMEVGGMMTHGAVVAREYGIPAIVGVDQATTRLRTGERIRIDGSSGQIVRLDDGASDGFR